MNTLRLDLGPVQYYWPKDKLVTFYREVADMPVDIVYLGETVCARRHELREDDWLSIASDLASTGTTDGRQKSVCSRSSPEFIQSGCLAVHGISGRFQVGYATGNELWKSGENDGIVAGEHADRSIRLRTVAAGVFRPVFYGTLS